MLPAPLRSLSLVLLTSWPPHTASSVTEVSITMPDNETVVQMKFTVNNNEADPERVGVRDIFYYINLSTNCIPRAESV